jgi:CHASE3 domain sensor protein
MPDRFTQNRFLISLLFSVSLVIFLAIGFASYKITQLWIANRQKVVSLRESLFLYERLLSLLKDAETGQRGYILTGDSIYLAPYQAAVDTIHTYQSLWHVLPWMPRSRLKLIL